MDPFIDDFDAEIQCEEVYQDDHEDDVPEDELFIDSDDDDWDGDWEGADAEVLASAGMGTDEDYGYFGDREDW